jgi:hypothetical protein
MKLYTIFILIIAFINSMKVNRQYTNITITEVDKVVYNDGKPAPITAIAPEDEPTTPPVQKKTDGMKSPTIVSKLCQK